MPPRPDFPKRSLVFYDQEQRRHQELEKVVIDENVAYRLTRFLIDELGLWQPIIAFHPRSRMHWWEEDAGENLRGPFICYSTQGITVKPGIRLTDVAHEVAHHWQFVESGDTGHNAEMAMLVDWTCAMAADLLESARRLIAEESKP